MTHINKFVLLMILLGAVFAFPIIGASFAHAADTWTPGDPSGDGPEIAPQTCDSDVWMTMENRARMETEREIMQNQNLIFKADSVLTYMCFDSFAGHAAHYVGELFTHTAYWGALIIPWGGQYGMDVAMTNVVIRSMKPYLDSNFDHTQLGGRGAALGLNKYFPKNRISPGDTYGCNQMATVWRAAKCLNFMHNGQFANTDGFYPFRTLQKGPGGRTTVAGYDEKKEVRVYPSNMSCAGGADPIPDGWSAYYGYTLNEGEKYYDYRVPNQQTFDEIRELVEPGVCAPTAVPTGLTVILSPSSTSGEPDGVCTNPGCTYLNGSCS